MIQLLLTTYPFLLGALPASLFVALSAINLWLIATGSEASRAVLKISAIIIVAYLVLATLATTAAFRGSLPLSSFGRAQIKAGRLTTVSQYNLVDLVVGIAVIFLFVSPFLFRNRYFDERDRYAALFAFGAVGLSALLPALINVLAPLPFLIELIVCELALLVFALVVSTALLAVRQRQGAQRQTLGPALILVSLPLYFTVFSYVSSFFTIVFKH